MSSVGDLAPKDAKTALKPRITRHISMGAKASSVGAGLAPIASALRDKTICEVVPDEADIAHEILSSRHHKGAHVFPSWLSVKVMSNELNRASKRLWEPIECTEHEGWHLVAGNQFFRIGR